MAIRLLDPQGFRRMPWKNGGGETIEMLVHPEGAELGAFQWRISMASVATNGPFSLFDGIDRTLCVLEGGRLVLDFGNSTTVLDPDTAPFSFRGDVTVAGSVPDGPIVDLNVMTRRGVSNHKVTRLRDGASRSAQGSHVIAFAYQGKAELNHAGDAWHMPEGHAALVSGDGEITVTASKSGTTYFVEILDGIET